MNGDLIPMFHTLSTAEYHDPYIRPVMARYVRKIKDGNEDLYDHVLSEDKFYQDCIQKYKNVVSHFFGAKEEI
eukprot:15359003-Ditylum_brightwellii.AAC.1